MSKPWYKTELACALDAVRQASQLCQAVRQRLSGDGTQIKQDRSPVTIADYGSQALVVLALRRAFPNDPIVAEETAEMLRQPASADIRRHVLAHVAACLPDVQEEVVLTAVDGGQAAGGRAGRFWTLDPIDGTKGFLRNDQYAVALALVESGEVVLGVLACPHLPLKMAATAAGRGCLFHATRQGGAQCSPLDGGSASPVRVAATRDPREAIICESVESGHTSHTTAAEASRRLGTTREPLRMDSQCKYAAVARGDAAIYLRLPTSTSYREKIWDHAAGCLLVAEAGGRVTDTDGNPLDFSAGRTLQHNRGVIATNGPLHDAVLAAIRAS
jgi:HAL2 family 3'(2'),5'-bisphosphate nucleotidase